MLFRSLLAHHTLAFDFGIAAGGVVDKPAAGAELNPLATDILDPHPVAEYEVALRGTRLIGQVSGPDGNPDLLGLAVVKGNPGHAMKFNGE